MCAEHVRPSAGALLAYTDELRPRMAYLAPRARRNVLAALEVATRAHEGQMRKSGEPFIIHPIAVAAILADMRMDCDSVVAGLLHDTVEDTEFTLEEVEELFGRDVRTIVEGETKFSKLAAKVHGQAAANKAAAAVAAASANGLGSGSGTASGPGSGPGSAPGSAPGPGSGPGLGGPSPSSLAKPKLKAKPEPKPGVKPPGPVPPGKKGKAAPAAAPDSVGGLVWARERDQAKREASREKQADNLRAMFLAMTEDVRVIIVKLADRLHNMRTLEHMSPAKQKEKARETLEFFAPLAHRLGMRRVKTELEELSFRYLYPEEHRHVCNEVEALKRRTRFAHSIASAEATVREVLENDAILGNMTRSVEVCGATKELYSVYRRMARGETASSMLDIATLTVVVDIDPSIKQGLACYHVLGRLHALWTPLPKRLKDYIAFPKPNGYQSLHTTVLLDQSQGFLALEIQIRTAEMHRIAEEGIAAELFHSDEQRSGHFASSRPVNGAAGDGSNANIGDCPGDGLPEYKASPPKRRLSRAPVSASNSVSNLSAASLVRGDDEWRRRTKHWLISIREYIEEFSSSQDLVDAVRRDLLGNRVFVFTPGRNIVDLILGSTPVDLAYAIHSDVGHQMIGAKVNGRMVRLDYKLQNADVVKIITSDSSPGPAAEWMSYAKSRTARQKIRQCLRVREREEMMDSGRDVLAAAAKRHREPEPTDEDLEAIMPRLRAVLSAVLGLEHIRNVEGLLIAVARGVTGSGNLSLEETVLTLHIARRRTEDAAKKVNGGNELDSLPSEVRQVARDDKLMPTHDDLVAMHMALSENDSMDGDALDEMAQFGSDAREVKVGSEEIDLAGVPASASQNSVETQRTSQETSYVELASCCHPVCGDEVMGIRLESDMSGVVVHRLQCDHMLSALHERPVNPRVVGVRWMGQGPTWEDLAPASSPPPSPRDLLERGLTETQRLRLHAERRPCQPGRIAITARDCDGLLSYVTGIVAGLGKSIRRSCTETDPVSQIATLAFEVLVEDTKDLRRILTRLKECEEVMSVRRVGANEGTDFFPAPKRSRSASGGTGVTSGQAKMIEILKDDKKEIIGAVNASRSSGGFVVGEDDEDYDDDVGVNGVRNGERLSSDMDMFAVDELP